MAARDLGTLATAGGEPMWVALLRRGFELVPVRRDRIPYSADALAVEVPGSSVFDGGVNRSTVEADDSGGRRGRDLLSAADALDEARARIEDSETPFRPIGREEMEVLGIPVKSAVSAVKPAKRIGRRTTVVYPVYDHAGPDGREVDIGATGIER